MRYKFIAILTQATIILALYNYLQTADNIIKTSRVQYRMRADRDRYGTQNLLILRNNYVNNVYNRKG